MTGYSESSSPSRPPSAKIQTQQQHQATVHRVTQKLRSPALSQVVLYEFQAIDQSIILHEIESTLFRQGASENMHDEDAILSKYQVGLTSTRFKFVRTELAKRHQLEAQERR